MTSFWCFIVNFDYISHFFLVFLLLTLNKQTFARIKTPGWQQTATSKTLSKTFSRLISIYNFENVFAFQALSMYLFKVVNKDIRTTSFDVFANIAQF